MLTHELLELLNSNDPMPNTLSLSSDQLGVTQLSDAAFDTLIERISEAETTHHINWSILSISTPQALRHIFQNITVASLQGDYTGALHAARDIVSSTNPYLMTIIAALRAEDNEALEQAFTHRRERDALRFRQISASIAVNPYIHHLNLQNTDLDQVRLSEHQALFDLISHQSISRLSMDNWALGELASREPHKFTQLITNLGQSGYLRSLNLAHNQLGQLSDKQARHLFAVINSLPLERLNLSYNDAGSRNHPNAPFFRHMIAYLGHNAELRSLNLSGNALGRRLEGEGMRDAFLHQLSLAQSLVSIEMSHNGFGSREQNGTFLNDLFSALKRNRHLEVVDLAYNNLDSQAIHTWGHSLQSYIALATKLQALHLQGNEFADYQLPDLNYRDEPSPQAAFLDGLVEALQANGSLRIFEHGLMPRSLLARTIEGLLIRNSAGPFIFDLLKKRLADDPRHALNEELLGLVGDHVKPEAQHRAHHIPWNSPQLNRPVTTPRTAAEPEQRRLDFAGVESELEMPSTIIRPIESIPLDTFRGKVHQRAHLSESTSNYKAYQQAKAQPITYQKTKSQPGGAPRKSLNENTPRPLNTNQRTGPSFGGSDLSPVKGGSKKSVPLAPRKKPR